MENPQEYAQKLRDWLKEVRKEKGISGSTLSEQSGITQASISRVETGTSAVTIPFLQKVMPALGLEFEDLVRKGFVKANPDPTAYFPDTVHSIASLSAEAIGAFIQAPLTAQVALLSQHHSKFAQRAVTEYPSLFDVPQLFSLTPSLYVEHISLDLLVSLVAKGDTVMLPADVGAYIHRVRIMEQRDLSSVAKQVHLSISGLRSIELKQGGRLRLLDAVALDEALQEDGRLVSFAWLVYKRYGELEKRLSEMDTRRHRESTLEMLITLSRLWQVFFPDENTWADDIQADIIAESMSQSV